MSKKNLFETWNKQKQTINQRQQRKYFKERDVLFINMGQNIGFEQNGKGGRFLRPVLVYKKFSPQTFLGIPLTKTIKNTRFYAPFEFKKGMSSAILSQIRLFDARRISHFYGTVSFGNYKKIKEKLIELLQ